MKTFLSLLDGSPAGAAQEPGAPRRENWRNKTQTEMREALQHPMTGYLEGNVSSLICLVWSETPNNPERLRKPTEFNSQW